MATIRHYCDPHSTRRPVSVYQSSAQQRRGNVATFECGVGATQLIFSYYNSSVAATAARHQLLPLVNAYTLNLPVWQKNSRPKPGRIALPYAYGGSWRLWLEPIAVKPPFDLVAMGSKTIHAIAAALHGKTMVVTSGFRRPTYPLASGPIHQEFCTVNMAKWLGLTANAVAADSLILSDEQNSFAAAKLSPLWHWLKSTVRTGKGLTWLTKHHATRAKIRSFTMKSAAAECKRVLHSGVPLWRIPSATFFLTLTNFANSVVGPVGPTGATGATGSSGSSGASGFTGSSGASGFTGSSGASGFTGSSGASGFSGSSGSTGFSGSSGSSGSAGSSGASGSSGPSGATGPTAQRPNGAAAERRQRRPPPHDSEPGSQRDRIDRHWRTGEG